MKEALTTISSQDIKKAFVRVEAKGDYVDELARDLGQTVYGQDEACRALARRVAMFEYGLTDPQRPLGVVFFFGPSGVGKTEMAHALSKHLFGDPDYRQLKILDCSEFSEPHTVMRLTGSPPSYVGYGDPPLITQKFLNARNIIVFDEVEKAHPQLWRLLLGIMEDGRLRTRVATGVYQAKEVELSFQNSFIILTSNIGSGEIEKCRKGVKSIGFLKDDTPQDIQQVGNEALRRHFAYMPEFLGRIDDIICFNHLERPHYEKIYWKFLDEINQGVTNFYDRFSGEKKFIAPFITTTIEFRDYCLSRLGDQFGAREMRHLLDKELLERVINVFAEYDMKGRPVVADYEDGKIYFYTDKLPEKQMTQEELEQACKALITTEGGEDENS